MKRRLILLFAITILCCSLIACGGKSKEDSVDQSNIEETLSSDEDNIGADENNDTLDNMGTSEEEGLSEENVATEDSEVTEDNEVKIDMSMFEDSFLSNIQVGDDTINRLSTVNDLMEAGWEIYWCEDKSNNLKAVGYDITLDELKQLTFQDSSYYWFRMLKKDSKDRSIFLWVRVRENDNGTNQPLTTYIETYKFYFDENNYASFMGIYKGESQSEIVKVLLTVNAPVSWMI